jgi:hypothetical protein
VIDPAVTVRFRVRVKVAVRVKNRTERKMIIYSSVV